MATTAEQIRRYSGPAVLSYGFRPFFLSGAIWAAVVMSIWLPLLAGTLTLPTHLSPIDWHVHELLFGYLPAVIAGFLLTAVPNWTGRLPVVGRPLLLLVAVWLAGRIAIMLSSVIGPALAAMIDLAFLGLLAAVIGREIVAGRNWRNLKVLGILGVLLAANGLHHLEAGSVIGGAHAARLGIAAAVMMVALIGGRIVPSFTRNWLARREPGRLPVVNTSLDAVALAVAGAALSAWVVLPSHGVTATLLLVAASAHAIRLGRWAGERTTAEPLVLILHVAYAFVPLGLLLAGLAALPSAPVPPSAAVHAMTAGVIGTMTLAVMTRAALGHSGRPLTATWPIRAIYAMAVTAAGLRVLAALGVAPNGLLSLAAVAWVAAFGTFAVVYWPMLTRPRTT